MAETGFFADFLFGVGDPAFAMDSALGRPGRVVSVWDVLAGVPDRIADGTRPVDAPVPGPHEIGRHVGDLGVDVYRLTASWAQLQPDGPKNLDNAALDHLDRLIDALVASDIKVWLTFPAGSLPLWAMASGGWLDRDAAQRFADLVNDVAIRCADRIDTWWPLSGTFSTAAFGYAAGIDAPGLTLLDAAFPAVHHLLLAHGLAAAAVRSCGTDRVGAEVQVADVRPIDDRPENRRAARLLDLYLNRQFAEPLCRGRYPRALGVDDDPAIGDGDLDVIAAEVKLVGVDHLGAVYAAAAPDNVRVPFTSAVPADVPLTSAGTPWDPESVTRSLVDLAPLLKGKSVSLSQVGDAQDDDASAPDMLSAQLQAAAAAVRAGVDLRSYVQRSLYDGWEGAAGTSLRYGLLGFDNATSTWRRRPVFTRYAELIAAHRLQQ